MLAVTAGVPYELLSGSYEGLNYSVSRAVRNDFAQQLRPIARRHMRQFCIPIHREFMFEAVTFGRLSLPGYFDEPRRYLRAEWQPPGMEALDPLKETKADADGVAACLRSPQEIARKRGRELEDVYKEIAAAKEMADEYGIAPEAISTATANNPAAIEEQ
jgi:capsid protein